MALKLRNAVADGLILLAVLALTIGAGLYAWAKSIEEVDEE